MGPARPTVSLPRVSTYRRRPCWGIRRPLAKASALSSTRSGVAPEMHTRHGASVSNKKWASPCAYLKRRCSRLRFLSTTTRSPWSGSAMEIEMIPLRRVALAERTPDVMSSSSTKRTGPSPSARRRRSSSAMRCPCRAACHGESERSIRYKGSGCARASISSLDSSWVSALAIAHTPAKELSP